ncbi:serine/threonine-protein kinase PknK [Thermoflexales bacterium]|nr:serine/threonine-protein kinase PknK [Thermoflexales bacterium]
MDLIGKTLGQYHIVESIGHGGMASVFKARQPTLDRFVAVKVLLPQQAGTSEFRERFIREAKAVAQLNHPNILPIIDYGQVDDLIYIVMKFVAGGTLSERLKHPIDLATTTSLIMQTAAALDHAHQRGIIHRDIKPSNVLLDDGQWVQLADFGLAKLLTGDQALTTSGLSLGTPAYLSPEQGQGNPSDQHADIYSLGVMLYEMVTGHLPFIAETPMGVIVKHIYEPPLSPRALNPDIPEALEAVILKGLAKPIEQRYHTAGELARALQVAVSEMPLLAFSPVVGLDANATPPFSPRLTPPTPVALSNKVLFEETVPAVPHFIGREAELAAYEARLDRDRLVILTGLAGMGKTTLGARLARHAADPDNVFWFTFDPVEKSTIDALYWAVATFLENRGEASLAHYLRGEIGAQKPLERLARLNLLIAALASGDYVLCFDDFQIASAAPEVEYFFKQIRQRFVELRQPLPARFIVMGRTVPPDMGYLVPEALRGLTVEATRQFLLERDVTLSAERLTQLWQQTEGNPKLLELSAGALADLSDEAAAQFITALLRRGDIRDYLMRNIYAALTPDEQVVMGALAVFPGPIERSGVEELLSEDQLGPIAQHLDALANKHVLELTPTDQIDCHDLVREYCYHVLSRRDRDRFHQRAAGYFAQEQNWLATAHHHFARRAFETALELLAARRDNIVNTGQAAALSDLLARFNTVTLTPAQRIQLHTVQGHVYRIRGVYPQAIAALNAAFDEAPPGLSQAELQRQISRVYLKMGEYVTALNYATSSLKQSEAANDQVSIAESHCDMGWAYYRQAKLERARLHFEIGHQIGQQLSHGCFLAEVNLGLGLIAWRERRLEIAEAYLRESRHIYRECGYRSQEAYAIINLGLVYGDMGDMDRRLSHYQQAQQVAAEVGDLDGLSVALNNLGYTHATLEQHEAALDYYGQLAELVRRVEHWPMLSLAQAGLADAWLGLNQPEQALACAQAAQEAAHYADLQLELGVSYRVLGDVWLALHQTERAREFYQQSLPLLSAARETEELAKAQHGLERLRTD